MKFVVTAGPTREPLDPVRFLSNRSSGKMGYALAAAALARGHEVTLISGPVNLAPPVGVRVIAAQTSDEMHDAVQAAIGGCDVFIMCAAVTDYKPAEYSPQKIKKQDASATLALVRSRDILAAIGRAKHSCLVVGFAAETENVEANAREKLRAKNCDAIIANDVSRAESGIDSDENELVIFTRDGARMALSRTKKELLGHAVIEIVAAMREKSLTTKT